MKMKTCSAAKKRLSKLKGGKIKRAQSYRRHLLTKKSRDRKRELRQGAYVGASERRVMQVLLPS